jgi:cyclopropane fatty-acyl-phospholipid synthase-like methyltransferase
VTADLSSADYRERLYRLYSTTHFARGREVSRAAIEAEHPSFEARLGSVLPEPRDAKILEIGSGYGAFLHYLGSKGFRNAVGIDVSPEQVRIGKDLGIENLYLAEASTYLRQYRNEFDCIVAIDLLEHLNKAEVLDFLETALASLKTGGRLIVHTINAEWPFFGNIFYGDFSHEVAFTVKSIRQVLAATGFTEIRVMPAGHAVKGFLSAIRWLLLRAELILKMPDHIYAQNLIAVGIRPRTDSLASND